MFWSETSGRYAFMGEVGSPLKALLHTREARGDVARADLEHTVQQLGGQNLQFRLCHYGVRLPLGWMLSRAAWQDMNRQLPTLDAGEELASARYNA
jgi:hypothetical protein